MSYATVADALAAKLRSTGLQVYTYPNLSPTVPCHVLSPTAAPYDRTARDGLHVQQWRVRTLVGAASVPSAITDKIYAYMAPTGTESVKAAVETDKTLGGVVDSARVTRHEEPGFYDYGGATLLGVEFTIEVMP